MAPDNKDKTIQQGITALFICLFGLTASVTYVLTPDKMLMAPLYYVIIIFSILSVCLAFVISYSVYREYIKPRKKEDIEDSELHEESEGAEKIKSYGNAIRKKQFLFRSEREFKELLQTKLPANIEIHCKVQLRDVLEAEIADTLNYDIKRDRQIGMMHLDYVLIDKKTERIILVIELDGTSHSKYKAKWKDRLKNTILHKSRVPLMRVSDIPDAKKKHPAIIDEIIDFCINESPRI